MSQSAIDIERVVREVLAELSIAQKASPQTETKPRGLGTSAPSAAQQAPETKPQHPISPPPSNTDLLLTSRVVTMTELLGRLDAARRVVVPRNAIVTPAVRDELIRRGIALEYADSVNGRPATAVRLVIVTTGTDFDPAALVAGLAREGLKIDHSALDCLIATTDQLAAEVAKPDTLGLALTRHVAAGLCLANRLAGVRAVTGADAPAVATAAAAVGANLLVVDPLAGTFFQLKQMVTEFCRSGARPCPAVFRARLA
jgi:hypothetical protein